MSTPTLTPFPSVKSLHQFVADTAPAGPFTAIVDWWRPGQARRMLVKPKSVSTDRLRRITQHHDQLKVYY